MSRSESRRLTFWIAVYCLAFTVVLCALYFLFVAVTAPWATHTGRLQTAYTASPVQVIVDAGHGGRDGGATGVTGLVEKISIWRLQRCCMICCAPRGQRHV